MYQRPARFSHEARQASWLTATLGIVALLIAAGSPIKVFAQTSSTPNLTFTFPMVAVIQGQSARLNVVNRTGSPGDLPPDVCDVLLKFVDRTGVVRLQTKLTAVASGQAVYVDLSASKLTYELGKRHELRAFVRVTTRQGSQLPPDVCKPSVEIYDEATGESKVLGWPPDPDLPAPQ